MKSKNSLISNKIISTLIIICIISLIGVLLINKYIESNEVESAKKSAEDIVKSAEQYYTNVMSKDGTFAYTTLDLLTNAELLKLEGDLPDGGYVTIDENSNIEVFLIKGKYCIRATSNEQLTKFSKNLDDCKK